jgi:hypothetical protein
MEVSENSVPRRLMKRKAGITKAARGSIEMNEARLSKIAHIKEKLKCYAAKWIEYYQSSLQH